MILAPGSAHKAYQQGYAITPRVVNVTVVWDDGQSVHYRIEGELLVKQTSRERFMEIIRVEVRY